MDKEILKKEEYSYEDNLELIVLSKTGNKLAMDKLIEINIPLVSSITKKFMNRGYEYEDIFQIGSMGLIKAINNFDASYNVKFSTYAVPMIIGEIKRFIRDDGMIKVSRSVKSIARKLHYDKEALSKELDREPTLDELSKFSGVDKEDIVYAMESASSIHYLYDTIHQDDGAPVLLIDKLSEKYEEDDSLIDRLALKEALGDLDAKSRQIIMLRYFKDNTQVEVAKMLGISQVQVSRIEKKVLKTMRKTLEKE
ncbi:RNA polymerase sporulation sigma factor SigF [Clostridium algidicarnis]|uniref:RNA polymerase sigma factor n=2 Tax=Clostridium algidicarnis TaxID=37659 RepID=A0A2S6G0V6_9CLOT|nr:RNA polymerase sporulation sigma factor SigF [Clostridium algidicarnis]MBB6630482.1 RNA polymerase sporulation sigma factor SigF [Clostridium algidicarnis]MBU3193600.1 RNA polymerase sporulation sigma factor SigF [Clostridium algidicarnis]MBU3202994.1 RNA polymerase sporulation sigma factor SigF [Clostridium algidicarnis]MBU3205707.1 RNA polymerase sporulation sigma factor SigF [Clostridium algidicarnis]MBU3208821.1 RNA polymerase sporulation sigma factor SigF [Clostridium algidicarnis]